MVYAPPHSNPLDDPHNNFFGGSGWNSFGGGGGTGGHPGSGTGLPSLPGPTPTEGNNNPSAGGGGSTGAPDPNNFGQAMHPWDMPYGGQFTAPMSPYENEALGGYSNFVQGGMGLNQSGNYLNDVLGGKYLDLNSNPYLQQIQHGMQGMKDYSDQQGLARIGSSMALGGNAMSGARLGASNDFMNNSNNAFETLMGNLMNQNYGMERNAMNQAPGQAANLANTASGAYGQLFGMGALPRNLQQHDYDSQYNDFMRQTGAMNHDSERPDNQLLQFLSNAGYKGQYQPTFGSSQGDILGNLLGQGGAGQTIWDLINGFGSGVSGDQTQQNQTQDQGTGVQFDGQVIGHDAAPAASGPANYYDRDWYQNALQQAKIKQIASMQNPNPNSNGLAIAALLMSILGGGGKSGKAKANSVGMGGGNSLANSAGRAAGKGVGSLWDSIFGSGNNLGGKNDPFGPVPAGNQPPDTSGAIDLGNVDNPYGPYGNGGDINELFNPENYGGGGGAYGDFNQGTGLFDPSNFADGGGYGGGDEGVQF